MTQNKAFRNGVEFACHRLGQVIDHLGRQLQEAREQMLEIPEAVYSEAIHARMDALPPTARWIFAEVLRAMQDAEEIGRPEGEEYIQLMHAITEEAAERVRCCRAILNRDAQEPS